MGEERQTCAELVALVKDKGPRALNRIKWLDEIVDAAGAAEFTGLNVVAVRAYHGQGMRKRAAGGTGWAWPEPDITLGGRPGWKLRALVLGRAAMPGRGAGGGRPWHKER